jgi:hypothetical protein
MGNSNPRVLTPEDALDIYERVCAGEKQSDIARDHVISQATVSGIKRGYHWNHVTGLPRSRPLTERQQRTLEIYSAYWEQKLPPAQIAATFGLTKTSVYNILKGRTGARLTGHPKGWS